jgi:DNA modification methylase
MAPYKLVGMSTTNPPYGFTSENMSKLSFDNYKNNMTNDFNKIQIALPFSNEQLKNFEMCNNMLQPGKMEQIDKIVNFCKPHILDELTDSLKSLLSTGQAAVGFHITFLVI